MNRLEFNNTTTTRMGELIFIKAELRGASDPSAPRFKTKRDRVRVLEEQLSDAIIEAQQDTGLDDYNMLEELSKISATMHGLFLDILRQRKIEENDNTI